MQIDLNGRDFWVEPISEKETLAMAKAVGPEMGHGFIPIATWFCDRKPGLKRIPRRINLAPLVFFTSIDKKGRVDPGKLRLMRSSVLKHVSAKTTKELGQLTAAELGAAKVDLPMLNIRDALDPKYRLVFGIYIFRLFFRVTPLNGPMKNAHFIMGLPIACEWGYWRVGTCSEVAEEGGEGTPGTGPKKQYKTLDKAVYTPFHTDSLPFSVDPPAGSFSILAEVLSPSFKWRDARTLPGRVKGKPDRFRQELTRDENDRMDRLRKTWDRAKDGKSLLRSHG